MARNRFYEEIKTAMDERGVETPYKKGLQLYFPDTDYTYPFKALETKMRSMVYELGFLRK